MILFAVADIKGLSMVLEIFFGLPPIYAAAIVALAISVYGIFVDKGDLANVGHHLSYLGDFFSDACGNCPPLVSNRYEESISRITSPHRSCDVCLLPAWTYWCKTN